MLLDSPLHTSSDEDEVRKARLRRHRAMGDLAAAGRASNPSNLAARLAYDTAPPSAFSASFSSSSFAAKPAGSGGQRLEAPNSRPEAASSAAESDAHSTAHSTSSRRKHAGKGKELHLYIEHVPPETTPPMMTSPLTTSSAPCVSPRPTRPVLVYNSLSSSSLSSLGTQATSTSPASPYRRMSLDLVDVFEGECCGECCVDGWDPPPDFACELEYPQGKRRPVVFMHLESRGRKSTPAIRAPSSVPETRPGRKSVTLDSGTYHIVDDADDDYDRYPTYGGSYESSSSGPGSVISIQSEAEEASVEAEIIDIASTSEAVMLMLPLAPNDYVVVHSHFVGPKVTQAPAKDGSDRQSDIFEFEGDVDRAEIATGPIREWWCTGFRVAEPALEGVFPLRALKGFEEVTDL